MSQVKTFENPQQYLISAITLPAYAGEDERIHVLSVGICRQRANFYDMDKLRATVPQQNAYRQGVSTT